MNWIFFIAISATIPEGWPMLRANQQRTGYISGYSCFTDTCLVKWQLLIEGSEQAYIYNGPVSADFNADGKKDILVGIRNDNFPSADLYNGENGAVLWQGAYQGGSSLGSPALMEVTGDGKPEVFLYTNLTSPVFSCLNGANGTGVWQNSSVSYTFFGWSGPLVIEGTPGTVIVGDGNGTLWSLDATSGSMNWSYSVNDYIQPPSLGDVDGDGNPEIVVVGGRSIYVFSTGGALEWNIDTGDSATTPALANLDTDPELEIVIYNYIIGRVRAYDCGNATPFIDVSIGPFNSLGGNFFADSPGLADITGDGVIDIVIHNGQTLYCINGATHGIEWSTSESELLGSPVIADLDNDNQLEIVVTGDPQPIYSSNYRLKIAMFEHTGGLKFRYACAYTTGYPDPSLNEACLANVDADGYLEISAADYSCWLVCLDCEGSGVEEDRKSQGEMSIINTMFSNKIELVLPSVKWVEYTMHDVCGRVVYNGRESGVGGKFTLNVSKIGTGVYFLKVKTPEETQTFKVVKVL